MRLSPIRSGVVHCGAIVPSPMDDDITYFKTHEGWLYLCNVIDLLSRRVVGWSAQSRMTTDRAIQTLLMAV